MVILKDPGELKRTPLDGDRPLIKEEAIYSSYELAQILFKNECKPTSHKTVDKWARQGLLKGRRVSRGWQFLGKAVINFMLRKGG